VLRLSWFALRALSSLNRAILRRFTLTGRVVLALLAGAAVMGIDTERSMTYQAFTLATALFGVAIPFLWWFRPRVEITRLLPPFATAGERCTYRLRLENRGGGDEAALLVADNLADPRPSLAQYLESGPPPGARSFIERRSGYARWRWLLRQRAIGRAEAPTVPLLPSDQSIELACELTPARRGMARFDSITLVRTDPLGLLNACRDIVEPQSLCVLPRRYRLPPLTLPGSRRYQHGGVALAASVGDSEEFVSLRAYRPGDPLQRVHWKSFARAGEPIVKEYQDEFFERHCLVLDTAVSAARAAAFEEAISVAASFVCAIDTRECLLDLLFVGQHPCCVTAGRGQLQAERLLELLAVAQPAGEGSFASVVAAVIGRRTELSSVIFVSAAWDEARSDLCAQLKAFGIDVLAAAIVNPGEAISRAQPWLVRLEVGRIEQDLARGFP
jgi:uncharacterized protein (DUF58 family)